MNKKNLLTICFFLLLIFFSCKQVLAVDLSVTCSNNDCSLSPQANEALFKERDIKPGDDFLRKITVTNNGNDDCYLIMDTLNEDDPNGFGKVLFTNINDGNTDYFGTNINGTKAGADKNLTDLFGSGGIGLGTIVKGGVPKVFSWLVSIDTSVGNYYQKKKLVFDFDLAFSCGNPPPSSPPSPSPSAPSGSPGPGVNSLTSTGAGGGGASPSPTTLAFTITPYTLGGGLIGAVSGIAEALTPTGTVRGEAATEVAGASVSCCPKICPWWWLLFVLQTFILSANYLKLLKKTERANHWWFFPAGLTVVSIVGHHFLHNWFVTKGYQPSHSCPWFWPATIIESLTFGLIYLAGKGKIKK